MFLGVGQVEQESTRCQEIRASVGALAVAGVAHAEKTAPLAAAGVARGVRAALLAGQLLRRRAVGHAGQALLAAATAHHQVRGRRRELQRRARGADRPELRLASGQTRLQECPRQRHHPQVALYAKVRNLYSRWPKAQNMILNICPLIM